MASYSNPIEARNSAQDRSAEHSCGIASSAVTPMARHRPRIPKATDDMERRLERLAATVELEIIPRLMLAHRDPRLARSSVVAGVGPPIDEAAIETLSLLVVSGDMVKVRSFVLDLQIRGTPLETIYLGLLAPTARRLGSLWEKDASTFTEVTVGLVCLQQMLRHLSPSFIDEGTEPGGAPRIVLAPVAGEQHTFGLYIVEDFFRRAGWNADGSCTCDSRSVRRLVARERIDVVGISVSGDVMARTLSSEIRSIRKASLNRSVIVMVGGSIFNEHPHLVGEVGADCTAVDGKLAVVHANAAVSSRSMPT